MLFTVFQCVSYNVVSKPYNTTGLHRLNVGVGERGGMNDKHDEPTQSILGGGGEGGGSMMNIHRAVGLDINSAN